MEIQVQLTESDKQRIREQVIESFVAELIRVSPNGLRKHAYTVAEVAAQIGYSKRKILEFIKDGEPTPEVGSTTLNIAK